MSKQEDNLYIELYDTHQDVFWKVQTLIDAKWDAPTLKTEIEQIMKHGHKLLDEIEVLERKETKGEKK